MVRSSFAAGMHSQMGFLLALVSLSPLVLRVAVGVQVAVGVTVGVSVGVGVGVAVGVAVGVGVGVPPGSGKSIHFVVTSNVDAPTGHNAGGAVASACPPSIRSRRHQHKQQRRYLRRNRAIAGRHWRLLPRRSCY